MHVGDEADEGGSPSRSTRNQGEAPLDLVIWSRHCGRMLSDGYPNYSRKQKQIGAFGKQRLNNQNSLREDELFRLLVAK